MSESLYGMRTVWDLVARRAELSADRPMLFDDDDRRVTFGEFKQWAERVAAGFTELGIGEGSAVSWQLPTRIETLVLSVALSRIGARQNPIIPIYREREVGFVLRQSQAAWFLVPGVWRGFDYTALAEAVTATMDEPPRLLVTYDRLPEGDPSSLPPEPMAAGPGEEAPIRWLYYTSGTTSDPKGVRHSDQTLLAGAVGVVATLRPTEDDVFHMAMPYAHIAGPDLLGALLLHGYSAVVSEIFAPPQAVEVCRRRGVTIAGGSTAFYTAFVNEQRRRPGERLIPSLRLLMGGGAPKPPEVFYEVKRELGVPVIHGYGMTEVPMIAFCSIHDTDEQLANTDGKPVRGAEIRVLGADGTVAPAGMEGELCVRGPMLFKGYTDPSLDIPAFDDDGYFRTGDLGVVRTDGHVVVTGRNKDIIIRKGENVSAKEVEDLLYRHPKIADVAVIGLPDRDRGERVCAVIETAAGESPISLQELQDYCRSAGLMMQKIPEQLEIVDALPRNATLKILKYQLRQQFVSRDPQESRPA
ncbi:MAG TPA: AMP-binding protein [Acidimicrobiales bacterium]